MMVGFRNITLENKFQNKGFQLFNLIFDNAELRHNVFKNLLSLPEHLGCFPNTCVELYFRFIFIS
jgi:hypothetical protein